MFNAGLGHNCDFKDAMGKPEREFLENQTLLWY
jgi:hypothetical protein